MVHWWSKTLYSKGLRLHCEVLPFIFPFQRTISLSLDENIKRFAMERTKNGIFFVFLPARWEFKTRLKNDLFVRSNAEQVIREIDFARTHNSHPQNSGAFDKIQSGCLSPWKFSSKIARRTPFYLIFFLIHWGWINNSFQSWFVTWVYNFQHSL